jgi:hypothetical protein
MAAGIAHRLESLNAFVSCTHASCKHRTVMSALYDACGTATEFEGKVIADCLATWAQSAEFSVSRTTVELRGRCKSCGSESRWRCALSGEPAIASPASASSLFGSSAMYASIKSRLVIAAVATAVCRAPSRSGLCRGIWRLSVLNAVRTVSADLARGFKSCR